MTIQRITFANPGAGVRWWEVDTDTGRILGCGPHDAALWANGRCSVDMASLAVGEAPIFFGPATEPGGRFFKYVVARIEPAETGGGWPL